jgi:sugar porter (SP) family MFS transporter
MYIAEIAPAKKRGWLVGFFQFNIVLGILLAYFSNYLFGFAHLGFSEWRWMLGVAALPAALFFIMLFFIPRSPRWLAKKGRIAEARKVLQLTGDEQFEEDLEDIIESISAETSFGKQVLFTKRHTLPIFLAISIGMLNQLSGINAVLYYLNFIFSAAGFGAVSASIQAIAVGTTLLIFTAIGMLLIERVGRRTLLMIGSVGTAGCLAGVAAIFFSHKHQGLLLWLLIAYIAFFASSEGVVIWVYISEIFPNAVRAKGQSLGSLSHWFMNALISMCFPTVAASSGAYPFVFFSGMMILQFFVVLFIYPETNGLTLEAMHKEKGQQTVEAAELR